MTDGQVESSGLNGFGLNPELLAQLIAGGVPNAEELRETPAIDVRYPVVSGDGGYVRLSVIDPTIMVPRCQVYLEVGSATERARVDLGDSAGLDLLAQWVKEAVSRVRPVANHAWEAEKPFREQAEKLASFRNLAQFFGGGQ